MAPDGAVKAMVGGVSYGKSQYNRAAQAKRQPGSSFKLFVYLSAIEAGYTPQTMVTDAPISLSVGDKTWSPDNNEKNEYRGDIPLYEALRHSLNTVSVRIITAIGPERVAAMAERLGVPNIPAYPSIALGAVEATLVEMTGAYAHLPNQGNRVVPYGIVSIRTRQGVELYKREAPTDEPVLAKGTVEMMNYMLLDVVRHGTGFKAHLNDRDAAGKTGTSSDYKDAWFIGFTPQLVTGVWVGNDDNKPMKKITGGTIPAEIWHNFMTLAMKDVRPQSIPNSASSSDGLLPWLFGGSDTAAPAGANNPPPSPTPASAIPANSPFGYAHPERAPAQPNAPGQGAVPTPAPPPTPNGTPQPVAPAGGEAPAPATETPPGDAGVLSPQFWKKLADKAPTIDHHQVQYSYPKQNRP